MNSPTYLIINPLQILLLEKHSNKISNIEEKFNNKMEKLKNIFLQNNLLKKEFQKKKKLFTPLLNII
jgi:hypothetical protein